MFTKAPAVCAYVSGTQTYPFDPMEFADETVLKETLVGFTAETSKCRCTLECVEADNHVQIDNWIVFTDKGMYRVDNAGIVYQSRMVHPFQ